MSTLYSIQSSIIFFVQRWKQLLEGGSSSVSNRCPHHPFPRELSCTVILHSFFYIDIDSDISLVFLFWYWYWLTVILHSFCRHRKDKKNWLHMDADHFRFCMFLLLFGWSIVSYRLIFGQNSKILQRLIFFEKVAKVPRYLGKIPENSEIYSKNPENIIWKTTQNYLYSVIIKHK